MNFYKKSNLRHNKGVSGLILPETILSLLIVYASLLILPGCSDDIGIKSEFSGEEIGTITILIPNIESAARYGATRGDEFQNTRANLDAKEGEFKVLWFFAYPVSNQSNDIKTHIQKLTLSKNELESQYKSATVSGLQEGKYHIYLLANFDDYLSKEISLSNLSEDNLKSLVLNYSNDQFLEAGNLPMYCLNEKIKTSENGNELGIDGVFQVNKTGNTIYADLTFLCSKVRYTILYDGSSGGFSEYFSSTDPDFEEAEASNIRKQTALLQGHANKEFIENGIKNLNFNKALYPSVEETLESYLNIEEVSSAPVNLIEITDWPSENLTQRAWQGVAYLPENISSQENDNSLISVEGKGEGMKESYLFSKMLKNDLERGKMYDFVAKLTGKAEDLETEVNIQDWTLETLSYSLHGPFELIVESTELGIVSSEAWSTMGFESDVDKIEFDSPKIKYLDKDRIIQEIEFFSIEEITEGITDENGDKYNFTDDFTRHLRIIVNPKLPLDVILNLKNGKEYECEGDRYILKNSAISEATDIEINSLDYFHIIAANLHKRIGIDFIDVDAILNISPLKIVIDTRIYYTSEWDSNEIPIKFFTNFDYSSDSEASFTLFDPDGLFESGAGEGALQIYCYDNTEEGESNENKKDTYFTKVENQDNLFNIGINDGELFLKVNGLTSTHHDFFSSEKEFKLQFKLKLPAIDGITPDPITKDVIIVIKPFTTTYTIHFKDNTKKWDSPHIFVYQDLTLPSDLSGIKQFENGKQVNFADFAGKIVGYIENNESLGLQWNAATQYVFSNNISFRGWKGYGGPEENDPYVYGECNTTQADNKFNINRSTMGFVMFGEPKDDGEWNFDYSYQKENTDFRYKRYRYDVNFNEDHEKHVEKWGCEKCKDLFYKYDKDYNRFFGDGQYTFDDPDGRGYPGIAMEDEGDGWWKYTLTGVAQPGKTMLFFANWHEPWNEKPGFWNYAIEDNRYPGDYEAGLQLFDFESNEGWFLFDGNGAIKGQHFYDFKPESNNVLFTADMANKIRVEIIIPVNFWKIQVFYPDPYTNQWVELLEKENKDLKKSGESYFIDITDSHLIDQSLFFVKILYTENDWSDQNSKVYELSPKNFKLENGYYVTSEPLRGEFIPGMKLFIKWTDNIKLGNGNFSYYPAENGCNYMIVNWYSDSDRHNQGLLISAKESKPNQEVGNYKHVEITVTDQKQNVEDKSKLYLGLFTSLEGEEHAHRILKIEDMPKFYNPIYEYYIINWHMLEEMKYQ